MTPAVVAATQGILHVENQWGGCDVPCLAQHETFLRVVPIDDTDGIKVMEMTTGAEVVVSVAEFSEGVPLDLIHQYVRTIVRRK